MPISPKTQHGNHIASLDARIRQLERRDDGRDELAAALRARDDLLKELHPSPQDETWLEGLPPGVLRDAALRLRELSDPGFAGQRPEGAAAEVASRALLELYAMATEVTP